jgi:hypothetical protein
LDEVEHREAEEIEADVVTENGVGNAEGHPVAELQQPHPLAAADQADHQGDRETRQPDQPP